MKSFILSFILVLGCAAATLAADPEVPIVQVIVSFQETDPYMPWQKLKPEMRAGYGVLLRDGKVITTEQMVRNARLIEIRLPRSAEKTLATIATMDVHADIAILQMKNTNVLNGLRPLDLAEKIPLKSTAAIYQFDENMEIQQGSGQIMHASVVPLADNRSLFLTFNMLTELSINGDSVPVLLEGQLAGIIIGYDRRTRIATILPASTIRTFLDDAATPPYEGFAAPGFLWKPLIQPAKRSYLGLGEEKGGVLILNPLPGMPAEALLKPNDVLLRIEGNAVDNLGFYQDPDLGRILFPYLVSGKKRPQNTITLDVIRDHKHQEIKVPLARWDDRGTLIPENIIGDQVDYIVEGGFILTELTGRYLRARGQGWDRMISSRIAYYYYTQTSSPEFKGKHIVLLSSVLPDQINIGYQDLRDEIITHVNGQPVNGMRDVFLILAKDGAMERVTIKSSHVDLVLDKTAIPEANARLARAYRIGALRYQAKP